MILSNMEQIISKAEVLIEALPYIQKFNQKKVVVKYGKCNEGRGLKEKVIKDVALLKLVGMQPIIVHGGGKEISNWLEIVGHKSEFVEGLQ